MLNMAYQRLMKHFKITLIVFSSYLLLLNNLWSSGGKPTSPPETVESVDLDKYVGKWYEIQRIPNSFQDKKKRGFNECFNTTAEYAKVGTQKISVVNTCYRYNDENKEYIDIARAKASIVENSNNAKLKVNFTGLSLLEWLGIGDGDYWILGLGPINENDLYSWAFVGSPKRDYGWILNRTRQLDPDQEEIVKNKIKEKGYDPEKFKSFTR
jgi:apolipoprotein D and lipocalin family protein